MLRRHVPVNVRAVALAACLALAMSACAKQKSVGSDQLLNFKDQAKSDCRLGTCKDTTTTAATAETSPPQKSGIQSAAATTTTTDKAKAAAQQQAQEQAQQQAVQAATLTVAVNGDSSGGPSQFDPSQTRVYQGSFIKWVNKDSVPRSVESDDGTTFSSGPIGPGASWTYTAKTPGLFNYHDGTRPYAVATLEVVKH
jgi:plastocyanin